MSNIAERLSKVRDALEGVEGFLLAGELVGRKGANLKYADIVKAALSELPSAEEVGDVKLIEQWKEEERYRLLADLKRVTEQRDELAAALRDAISLLLNESGWPDDHPRIKLLEAALAKLGEK